jgi:DNA-binding HxlR family transcriptional regulator
VDERRLWQLQSLLSHQWDLVVLVHLHQRPYRVLELVHVIHLDGRQASERVVRDALKRFCAGGLACRHRPSERTSPYVLTPWGKRVAEAMVNLVTDDEAQLD